MARYSNSKPELRRASRILADSPCTQAQTPDYLPPVNEIEDPEAYNKHLQAHLDFYKPQNAHIDRLVRDYAEAAWREQRHAAMVEELFDLQLCESYNDVEGEYPNADNRLHGTLTYRRLCADNHLQDNAMLLARAQAYTASKLRMLESAIQRRRA